MRKAHGLLTVDLDMVQIKLKTLKERFDRFVSTYLWTRTKMVFQNINISCNILLTTNEIKEKRIEII